MKIFENFSTNKDLKKNKGIIDKNNHWTLARSRTPKLGENTIEKIITNKRKALFIR